MLATWIWKRKFWSIHVFESELSCWHVCVINIAMTANLVLFALCGQEAAWSPWREMDQVLIPEGLHTQRWHSYQMTFRYDLNQSSPESQFLNPLNLNIMVLGI